MSDATAATLADLLMRHPLGDDQVVLVGSTRTWTTAEARRAVDDLAGALRHAGLADQHAVGVLLDGADVVVAMTAVWAAGGVFVPLNPRLPPAALDDVLDATRPALLLDANGIRRTGLDRRYDDGAAFVLWTSGTTGRPKPVVHTHAAYLELIDRVLTPLRGVAAAPAVDRRPTPNLIPVSMALNAGIYNALFGLRAGAPLVVMDRFDSHAFAEAVGRHGIRSTVLPPAAIAMLNDSDVTGLEPLRYVRSITAPLSPFQARRFTERFGVTVLNGYGQAEIGEVVGWTAAMAREHPGKIGSVGRPHPGVDLRIDAPDANGVGELLVRPPNRAAGYAGGADLGGRVTPDGFVRTGDLARLDPDGFVWIEGRRTDLINRGGNKIFPDEVDEVIAAVPGVIEAAVAGVPDERLGEVPVAFVVAAADADRRALRTALEAACRTNLVPYKVPADIVFVEVLPRNEIGKVRRADLVRSATDPR